MKSTSRIVLITGANRGIGLGVAKAFHELGHQVILTSRSESSGLEAKASIGDSPSLHYHQLDVDDQTSIHTLTGWVKSNFGQLDVLINNAGINYDTWQTASEADLSTVEQTLTTNLIGPWRLAQAFIPMMKEKGFGRIVNVSSGSGSFEEMGSGTPAYAVSKAALNALTVKLGKELKGTGILVNAVCPGWVRTDMGGAGANRSIAKGAETIVWAGLLPTGGPTADFFRDKRRISW